MELIWSLLISLGLALIAVLLIRLVRVVRDLAELMERHMLVPKPDEMIVMCSACDEGVTVQSFDQVGPAMAHHAEFECSARNGA